MQRKFYEPPLRNDMTVGLTAGAGLRQRTEGGVKQGHGRVCGCAVYKCTGPRVRVTATQTDRVQAPR